MGHVVRVGDLGGTDGERAHSGALAGMPRSQDPYPIRDHGGPTAGALLRQGRFQLKTMFLASEGKIARGGA